MECDCFECTIFKALPAGEKLTMNKYALMLAAALLISTAPVYYAFQAQAEETQPVTEETVAVDCTAIPDDQDVPAECVSAAAPAAGEPDQKAMPENFGNE